ncbi:MAG TPA: glycogen/starch/alpha-glucan phosphorylase [Xanthobacteraceae bacterium]|jgi:starch phosphorylase
MNKPEVNMIGIAEKPDPQHTGAGKAISATASDEDQIAEIKSAVLAKLTLAVGKDPAAATDRDWFVAAALTVRDRVIHRWLTAERASRRKGRKRVYYLSLEFLIGRLFDEALGNLQLGEIVNAALGDLGVDLGRLRASEPDAALGNGGLGRLAACFLESMATLGIPACGYGIRYDHGLFRQVIRDGWQQEYPEEWLSFGNPWELERPEVIYDVRFGGRVEQTIGPRGIAHPVWHPGETIEAVAYDTPVVGWRGRHVNVVRLWSARAPDPLRLDTFNQGEHVAALSEQARAEAISKVLYPSDESPAGQELRLRQEYFFVSASLQDLVSRHLSTDGDIHLLPDCAAVQLNDTHPSIAVPELMRILIDLYGLPWDEAWRICVETLSYTNHTLLPEALESWPLALLERMLPRHVEIIYRINEQHLQLARAGHPADQHLPAAVSLIDERGGQRVRMGHLAFVGSHRINGVSALHTGLMRQTTFAELHRLYPDRIVNKTNGISFRRWLMQANPGLTKLLRDVCGAVVLDDQSAMARLAAQIDDTALQARFASIKRSNKATLGHLIYQRLGFQVDPDALFDVQIKRIHEYKRQLLNLLETIALYMEMRAEPERNWVPRVKIFAGKAAASYTQAKLIIKLANDVAAVVNNDPAIRDLLKVAFLPNYNVSLAESIIPAADLSEQISTAGMEASGTGSMKLALNGALTIGTLDGATVEIRDHVGADNIFIFGLTAHEVEARRRQGLDAVSTIAGSPRLAQAIAALESGLLTGGDLGRFTPLANALRWHDYYMVTADFDAYYLAQRRIAELWQTKSAWARMSMLNVARMGWFSSDRSIGEYARDIWNVPAEPFVPSV